MCSTWTKLTNCTLCPRACGANRLEGQPGFCGAVGSNVILAAAMLHLWEEPCLSGTRGSGAVFFSYCTMRCVFCQNQVIRTGNVGAELSSNQLAQVFLDLEDQGAHNINLVTPTHYVPQILEALQEAKQKGLSIPVVYNSSGYEVPETIRLLDGLVDIYLPDLKYDEEETARRYSSAPRYAFYAWESLRTMVEQVGSPCFGRRGRMKSGVIVRHLVLPGQAEASKRILKRLYQTYGNRIFVSIMNQYTPMGQLGGYPELTSSLPQEEYQDVVTYARSLGMEQAYIQEGGAISESFVPHFEQLAEECRRRWAGPIKK